MMKKMIAIILCIVMASLCFAACGKDVPAEEPSAPASEVSTPEEEPSGTAAEAEQAPAEEEAPSEAETVAIALSDLTAEQLDLFAMTAESFVEDVKAGVITAEEMEERQEWILEDYIAMGELPENALDLFREWKDAAASAEQLAETEPEAAGQAGGAQPEAGTSAPNAPSDDNNTIGNPGQVITPGGGDGSNITRGEDIGVTAETTLASLLAKREGITYEEALKRVQNGQISRDDQGYISTTGGEAQPEEGKVITASGTKDDTVHAEDIMGSGFDEALTSEANRIAKEKGISFEEALAQVKADWGVE